MEFPRSEVLVGWDVILCIDDPWSPSSSCFWWVEYFCATARRSKGGTV